MIYAFICTDYKGMNDAQHEREGFSKATGGVDRESSLLYFAYDIISTDRSEE